MSANTGYRASQMANESNKFDFYSGSQITIWFGNIHIDDINSIQWVRSNSKMPIFGYASQLHDGVASGIVTIQGNFTINFRQRGFLAYVMDSIRNLYTYLAPDDPSSRENFNKKDWKVVRQMVDVHLRNDTFGPKTISDIQAIANSPNFYETVKLNQNLIYDDVPDDGIQDSADIEQTLVNPNGFDILVQYGNSSYSQMNTMNDRLHSTTKSLHGVHLMGEAQSIQVGGQPVQEQYSFIARNTDE